MKLVQTDSQLTIKQGGSGQLIIGLLLMLMGIGLAMLILGGIKGNASQAPPKSLSILGGVFALIGLALIIFTQKRATVIQKGGEVSVTSTRLIGGKSAHTSFPATDIKTVRLNTYRENGSNSRRSELSFVRKDGSAVQLGTEQGAEVNISGMAMSNLILRVPLGKEAQQIASFLGVPLDSEDTSTITGAIKTVQNAINDESSKFPEPPETPPIAKP